MYLEFYGLSEKPFSNTPDMHFLYMGKTHEKAIATITYAIQEKLGFALLTGEVGAGKTTLTRALLGRLDDRIATSLVINPLLSVPELLKSITKDFGIPTRILSPQRQIEALNKFALDLAAQGKTALVVIDEAQDLSAEALEAVRLLTNLETDKQKLVQILLVGQPELLKKLKTYELRQLDQRITTRVHLKPLDMVEMMRYLNHRLATAGGNGKVFFEPQTYHLIFSASQGYPRLINHIADRALMASFVRETYIIDRDAVKAAIRDWGGAPKLPLLRQMKQWVVSTLSK